MQGVRSITFKKILSVVIFLTCLLGMAPVYAAEIPPEIFIGDTPAAIKIQPGQPVKIPIFFAGNSWADKEVELYVFRVEAGDYFCFGPNGWASDYAGSLEDFKPLCTVQLPKYIYLSWQAFENTRSLSNFDLWVCVDNNMDGVPTENSIYCGHQLVVMGNNDTARDVSGSTGCQPPPLSSFWTPGGTGSSGGLTTAPTFPIPFTNSQPSNNWQVYSEDTTSSGDKGECDPNSVFVSPESLSFQASSSGEQTRTLYVKDGCRHAVDANATVSSDWLKVTETGTGEFSVSCDTSGLSSNSSATITITLKDSKYSQRQYTVGVALSDASVTAVSPGTYDDILVAPGHPKFFKFVAGVSDCSHYIRVGNTPKSPFDVHVLVKRGGMPTEADFDKTWDMPPSHYDCYSGKWSPAKPADLYWKYNTGSNEESVLINEPMEPQTFYIMLYNKGTQTIQTRLIVSYSD